MKKILFLSLLLIIINSTSFSQEIKIDSISLVYEFSYNSIFEDYTIIYSESNGLTVQGDYRMRNNPYKLSFPKYKKKFLSDINEFYIAKTTPTIEKKINSNEIWVTDHPYFRIECFYNNKKVLSEKTPLSHESYDLIFNEKYEDFIELIKKMTRKYDRTIYDTDTLRQKYWRTY